MEWLKADGENPFLRNVGTNRDCTVLYPRNGDIEETHI
jgi:hypothetical protein